MMGGSYMALLHFLEDLRFPVMDEIMLFITTFGEETVFLVVAMIVFWCMDKHRGYYLLTVGFLGMVANQFLKLVCRVPRPWVQDPSFTILEQAREAASGYSFPSGHTQSAVGTFGAVARTEKNKGIQIACIVIAVLVPFSRMYIGVHTPQDVLVAAAIALILVFVLEPLILKRFDKVMPWALACMLAVAIGYTCFVEFAPFPADIDLHNLESGRTSAYTLLGSLIGLTIVYIVDEKWQNFNVKAVWWAQILKVALGLGIVLLVKSGTKEVLNALLGEYVGRAVRYCLVVLTAGIVWPQSFRWFSKLGNKVR